jgi:hypothetical protein
VLDVFTKLYVYESTQVMYKVTYRMYVRLEGGDALGIKMRRVRCVRGVYVIPI